MKKGLSRALVGMCFLLFPFAVLAQSSGSEISGKIIDQHTHEGVKNVTVKSNAEEVKSDESGFFIFENTPEEARIEASHRNYYSKTVSLEDGMTISLRSKKLPLGTKNLDSIITDNIVLKAGDGFEGTDTGGSEENILQSFFSGDRGILFFINRIIGAVGILFFVIVGIKYLFSSGDESKMEEYKKQLTWIAVGLGVVSVAEFIGFQIFNPTEKDILSDDVIAPFSGKVRQIIRFLEYLVGGIFLFNGILTGYKLITSDQEDSVSAEKTFLRNFLIGGIFILLAEVIVRAVSLQDGVAGSQNILIGEIGGLVNFGLSFIAGACGLMLILASLYYVISFGDEEQTGRAKKAILGSVIGLVLSFSSYVIAQFLII